MIGATSHQNHHADNRPLAPGNKANSVGHQAKAAVQAAKEAGLDLPRNAQGMAASAIAKGAAPASVFAALVAPDVVPDAPVGDVADDLAPLPPDAPAIDPVAPPVVDDGPEDATPPQIAVGEGDAIDVSAEEIALSLLAGEETDTSL